ncbi:MAG: amino acid adenylation domain-containing protein, partial [Stigonema ocellatum SAG 48.90 = DSM 106950]|nr:amino acid adenylation domain-containing protein [Stigonema ocellatum SAG 48.90 = DSM 106950]
MDNIADIYELSPMQQGMLFHTLYAPKSGVYFEQLSCTLQGNLNVLAFKQAWQEVVARHAILRTSFYWEEVDKPLQVVRLDVDIPWEEHDWLDLTLSEQQQRLEGFLLTDREQGFQLDQAPLIRFTLIKVRNDTYQFVWSYHHLLMDGWCMYIIFKEVLAFYEARQKAHPLYLKAPFPFGNYILWLQQQNLSQAETFWRQTLQGFTNPTSLLTIGDQSNQSETCDRQHFQLSETVSATLQSLVQEQNLTLNTLVQGSWALLLSRYSRESDVVFGITVSGRPPTLLGVESMVGLFINTLPLRVQISATDELLPWLQQLQVQQVELQQYSYSPLVEIQGWSDVPRGRALFESIVVFENYPIDATLQEQSAGLDISNVRTFEKTNYPLTVIAVPGQELSVEMAYDSSYFDACTIRRMLGHFQTLLEGIASHPQQLLGDLPWLTERERDQLLVEWNNTEKEYPSQKCIHELFEAQVQLTPDAVALVFEDTQLTYHELNRRGNKVAEYLLRLGVKPEVLVGLCVERSVWMVVGLLGILKAGGAYVPLDPNYPQQRLSYMLEDSQVSVLLTQQSLRDRLPNQEQVVCLDTNWQRIDTESGENLVSGACPDNLAYVIYTSGSTGKPKGVLVSHQAICNHMFWMQTSFPMMQTDKVLQKTPFSFDASVWEFYAPLLVGAQLVMARPGGHQDSAYTIEAIAKYQITTLQLVPSLLRMLLSEGLENCKSLHRVFCGGEALPVELVERFNSKLDAELYNLYGPTETTIDATFFSCKGGNSQQIISIGKPIGNTKIYILDKQLQPVPVGVEGELYIGGAGLARGYLKKANLSA